jgi:hypothetical protein
MRTIDAVDHSRLSSWLRCPQHHEYRHVEHLAPKKTAAPLSFGKAMHSALESYHISKDIIKAKHIFKTDYKNTTHDTRRTVEKGILLLEEYDKKYKNETLIWRHTETPFSIVLPNDVILSGRADGIVEDMGYIYVFETKTTSQLGASFMDKFRYEFQIDIYCIACRELVGACNGAYIDAIRVRENKVGRDDLFRGLVGRTDKELDLAIEQIVLITEEMKRGVVYKNKSSCFKFNSSCEYLPLCSTINNNKLKELDYKKVKWNSLLGQEEEL